jgi:general secretion pathway protein H
MARQSNHLPPRRARGFTLIELILVLLILAIIAGMVVANLRAYARGRDGPNTAAHIVTLANYGRARAIADGVVVRLNFDPATARYWLTRQDINNPGGDFLPLGEEMGEIQQAPDGIQLQWDDSIRAQVMSDSQATGTGILLPDAPPSNAPFVEFQPSGRTDPAGIRVIDRDGSVILVACPSATELFRVVTADPNAPTASK